MHLLTSVAAVCAYEYYLERALWPVHTGICHLHAVEDTEEKHPDDPHTAKDVEERNARFREITKYATLNFDKRMQIKSPADASRVRKRLAEVLFKGRLQTSLPKYKPDLANFGNKNFYLGFHHLSRVDLLQYTMDYGLVSNIYKLTPRRGSKGPFILHQGHEGDPTFHSRKLIQHLLDRGYTVYALGMLLKEPNVVRNNHAGSVALLDTPEFMKDAPLIGRFVHHNHFQFFPRKKGHPIRYFIEPAIAVLNLAQKEFPGHSISMGGPSGGGWTTTLTAAVDPRVETAFDIAGSLPMTLREFDLGDYEQTAFDFYSQFSYLDLYAMNIDLPERRRYQLVVERDAIFYGDPTEFYNLYKARLQKLGFDPSHLQLIVDRTDSKHGLTDWGMRQVLDRLTVN